MPWLNLKETMTSRISPDPLVMIRPMPTIIADKAKLIVNGYAFSELEDGLISILNLNHPDCAMVVRRDGEIMETNMDPIEQKIVLEVIA